MEEARERADYRLKFLMLRDYYPELITPGEDVSLEELRSTYEVYRRKIKNEEELEKFKHHYLILMTMMEFISKDGLAYQEMLAIKKIKSRQALRERFIKLLQEFFPQLQ